MYVEAKPTLDASMEEHGKVEKALEARLKEIETEKLAMATSEASTAKKESPKPPPKSKPKARKKVSRS
jgi:hypothetical protein